MCWYSAVHAKEILDAEAGQRLVVRKVHGSAWVVRESDVHKATPSPVCLIDKTTVLFRLSEEDQAKLHVGPEAQAVFRMMRGPKRDVFQFSDGSEVEVNRLPVGLIFDVLEVPGKKGFSGLIKQARTQIAASEPVSVRESFLERVLQLF